MLQVYEAIPRDRSEFTELSCHKQNSQTLLQFNSIQFITTHAHNAISIPII